MFGRPPAKWPASKPIREPTRLCNKPARDPAHDPIDRTDPENRHVAAKPTELVGRLVSQQRRMTTDRNFVPRDLIDTSSATHIPALIPDHS